MASAPLSGVTCTCSVGCNAVIVAGTFATCGITFVVGGVDSGVALGGAVDGWTATQADTDAPRVIAAVTFAEARNQAMI